jgi:orotidine-5'-phosphate decarboxylase
VSQHHSPEPKDRLIVALDFPRLGEAKAMVETLGDAVTFYKIGMQLSFAGGLDLAAELARAGKQVFLDMKLLDIANTVEGAVASIAAMGMRFTTVHAYPQTMRAAAAARGTGGLQVLAVTVLTSLDAEDLRETGYERSAEDLVALRARAALACGIDGVVASPREAALIRRQAGDGLLIVTPGIRPAGSDAGDQKRIATPAAAIRAGADYLVVGRPVTTAAAPRDAALRIVEEISGALV